MANHGAKSTISRLSISEYSRWNVEENRAKNVSPMQITRSISAATHRFTGTPMACRVSPEEYRSMVLTARQVATNRIIDATRTHAGNACGRPAIGSLAVLTTDATAAPRTASRAEASMPDRDAAQKIWDGGGFSGKWGV